MSNQTSPLVHSLDARFYTDPEIFAKELEGLMATTWQFAGHASQAREAGEYVSFEVAGESLFFVRGDDGKLRTFYNVCQHRAHQLVSGQGKARRIVCPYHAWTYELDGQLKGGPNTRAVVGFDKEKICLSQVSTEVFCGFVFVNLDPNAAPMAEWFPNVEQELRAFVPHIDELQPIQWVEIPEKCNWKVTVENYSECYHCSINHPTFSTGVVKPQTYNIMPQGHCLRHTTDCQNLDKMSYPIDLEANEHAGHYSSWFLWPMFSFQVYPGNILNTYHWRAHGVSETSVWRGWYSVGGEPSKTIAALAKQDRETTVEEDIHLVESVQRGLSSRGYQPGPLVIDPNCGVNSEHSVHALQSWVREALDDDHAPSKG
ncbi:aromatic ring-hydroxylating dioxygenase subunit alpha [Gammaproteobacteria bacterium]|nr:aromatic ring-hydroxylating dioxygenase subunit alpha [Gammaproteobacteria bacterium]